eukprot:CAMPEP_0168610416 /NCGR_PEP_ID=MMETSP0449_2-20121227/1772_1 /TAXON_ID=1082188 /ORGANISM="Strombidium rassoulzadegani, Strain ras09" /LENGTH=174 /DNA_ID=CAMNT_0008650713 /DNA_START=717 /DNA_END=1243 /DNA_ORIENTATION=+
MKARMVVVWKEILIVDRSVRPSMLVKLGLIEYFSTRRVALGASSRRLSDEYVLVALLVVTLLHDFEEVGVLGHPEDPVPPLVPDRLLEAVAKGEDDGSQGEYEGSGEPQFTDRTEHEVIDAQEHSCEEAGDGEELFLVLNAQAHLLRDGVLMTAILSVSPLAQVDVEVVVEAVF